MHADPTVDSHSYVAHRAPRIQKKKKNKNKMIYLWSLRRVLNVWVCRVQVKCSTIYGTGCSFFSSLNLIQRCPVPAFKTQTSIFNSPHIHIQIQIQSTSHRPSFTSLSPPQTIKNLCLRFSLQPRGADWSRGSCCLYSFQGICPFPFTFRLWCLVLLFFFLNFFSNQIKESNTQQVYKCLTLLLLVSITVS